MLSASLKGIAINCLTEIKTLQQSEGCGHVFSKVKDVASKDFPKGFSPGPRPMVASPLALALLGTHQIYTWIVPLNVLRYLCLFILCHVKS